MADLGRTSAESRPILLGQLGRLSPIAARQGRTTSRIRFTNLDDQRSRLDRQMDRAAKTFADAVLLADSVHAADPQLVLVLEGLDERTDLQSIANRLDLELLIEVEEAIDPDEDVQLVSEKAKDPQITSCIHAICLNQSAMNSIVAAWREWRRGDGLERGLGPLSELFEHLHDVRPWGPQDRLKSVDWDEYFAGRIEGQTHVVDIELWYRGSSELRESALAEVGRLVGEDGGEVIAASDLQDIGYLGMRCRVSETVLRQLASGDFESVALIRSSDVLFFRVGGQGLLSQSSDAEGTDFDVDLPQGSPRVVVIDGVPASNHPRLAGRVLVTDPDDLASYSEATVELRRHGTWMASAVVWGDLAAGDAPLSKPVLVRPVLIPSPDSLYGVEEFRDTDLVPDLMRRIFRELFAGNVADNGLTIVNISLGDPALPFDSIMSSWARMLDWLSFEYGVLVVVSAGNHRQLELRDHDSVSLTGLAGPHRSAAVQAAQNDAWSSRRILSPAESVNAITVGALHDDATRSRPGPYVFDPHDGLIAPSPVSGMGGGHRRAIKPELAAPGGRVMFDAPILPSKVVAASGSSLYGIRVASPVANREAQVAGTSPAAALVSRRLSAMVDLAEETADELLPRAFRSVAAKALLVHGARHPEGYPQGDLSIAHTLGYGVVERDLSEGCLPNEATLLFLGDLGSLEEQELLVPLPDGLGVRGLKRVTATVAWLSPVNWRHRQYRKAQLAFAKPRGFVDLPGASDIVDADAGRGSSTVKHQVWEVDKAFGGGRGDSITLKVNCHEQAGGLDGARVPYAAVVSLWVAPELAVDVYAQVAQQVRPRVVIGPRG